MSDEIAKLLALREGLPEGPWLAVNTYGVKHWYVHAPTGIKTTITHYVPEEPVARAIAALPSLFAALEQAYRRPLPEEIAELIERLKFRANPRIGAHSVEMKAAAALEQMWRENAELTRRLADKVSDANLSLLNRIRELEAERDAIGGQDI